MKDLLFAFLVLALGSACGVPCQDGRYSGAPLVVVNDVVQAVCGKGCLRYVGDPEDAELFRNCTEIEVLGIYEAEGRLAAFDPIESIEDLYLGRISQDIDDHEEVRWELHQDALPSLRTLEKLTTDSYTRMDINGLNALETAAVFQLVGGEVGGLNGLLSVDERMSFSSLELSGLASFSSIGAKFSLSQPQSSTIAVAAGMELPSFTTAGWDTLLASDHGDVSAPVLTRVAGSLSGRGRHISFPAVERVGGPLIISGRGLSSDYDDTEFVSVGDSVHALHLIISQTTTYTPDNFEGHVDVDGAVFFNDNSSTTKEQIDSFLNDHVGEYEILVHCSNADDGSGNCIDLEYDLLSRPSIPQLQCQVLGDCEECERHGTCL